MGESEFENGTFPSSDGLKLFYRYFSHPEARNTIIILHGHGEHTGRYVKFLNYLKNEKLSIAMYDFRGHGRSEGRVTYVDSFEDLIADVDSFLKFLQTEKALKTPFLLLGHSNGGLVAVHWALRNGAKLKSLVLSSPCLGLRLPAFIVKFNRWMNAWAPRFIYGNPVYPPYLTHNDGELEQYKKDKLIRRKISVRLLDEMLLYSEKLRADEPWKLDCPVTVLMSGLDKVVDGEKTQKLFQSLEAPKKEITIFDQFYHEIFNEKDQERVFQKLVESLRKVQGP